MKKIEKLTGGWRKNVFRIGKAVVGVTDNRDISLVKTKRAVKFETRASLGGIPGREFLGHGEWRNCVWTEWKYLRGENKWQWDKGDVFEAGKLLKKLHEIRIVHNDLKPGNVLWKGKRIIGLIDYEEAEWKRGDNYLVDIANSLSWIIISGGLGEEFIRGYGGVKKEERDRMDYYLVEKLKQRMAEGGANVFLELAKKRLFASQKEIREKLLKWSELEDFREKNKKRKIVLVCGAYELLHWGHFAFLKKAKKMGDLLVVAVGSDESRKRLKGNCFPLIGEKTRAETMCYFDIVDGVVIAGEDNAAGVLKRLKPEVFVTTTKDWEEGVRKEKEKELLKENGGKLLIWSHLRPKVSSSSLVYGVAMVKAAQIMTGKVKRQPMLKLHKRIKIGKEVKFEKLEDLKGRLKKEKKTVVFASLSADLFHLGHARFVQKAKSLGDVLVVGIPSNRGITAMKGLGRPIVDESARALVMSELKCVDYVVIFDERTILGCLQKLRPEVFFTVKEEWNSGLGNSPEAVFMKEIGGKIARSERQAPYISASKIIDKAAGDLIREKFSQVLKVANEEIVLNADMDPFSPESQLAAREKGFYEKVWKIAEAKCVFCDLKEKYIIKDGEKMVLTAALFPYIDGHLLIVSKRHIESVGEMTKEEEGEMMEMVRLGVKLLKEKMGVESCWFLAREGDGIKAGKTVRHVHFHVLPYDPKVIKMGDVKLSVLPIDLAKKLKGEK